MSKRDELSAQNTKLNDINFKLSKRIKKLKTKLLYIGSIKTNWAVKDRIRELEHRILINEQQVRFNLMVMLSHA
jgi:hypothetical protein